MVGVFGRVFVVGPVFRAEKPNPSRQVNDYTSLVFEMMLDSGFVDIMQTEANMLNAVFDALAVECAAELELPGVTLPRLWSHEPRYSRGSGMIDRLDPRVLAKALVHGARAEVDLTPKPGLVDRHDNGSHPDLDHARMMRSIELLPRYYEELIRLGIGAGQPEEVLPLAACIDAGRRAELRMEKAIGANAHRGYIFLSGLLLLATCDAARQAGAEAAVIRARPDDGMSGKAAQQTALRRAIVTVARAFFAVTPLPGADRPGARVREARGLGGVRAEALAGLPSVFEAGLPAYLATGSDLAAFHALAALMQSVEDTTAVARCGVAGLGRLRRDGAALQVLLDQGDDPRPVLAEWNDEYRAQRLTMGGVADCLALVLALAAIQERAGSLRSDPPKARPWRC